MEQVGSKNTTNREVGYDHPQLLRVDRGTSWLSVIFGWLTALGAGLILSGIVGAVVGAIFGAGSASSSATEGGTAGLIGLPITLLLAFIIRGYVAGRLASRSGQKHGPAGSCCGPGGHDSFGWYRGTVRS
ncbi:MAG TPA: hypothetical protein VEY13_15545 [Rubrobacteraceae bacterium]|nr:hypothetical protein [Rubrobacteraceae bacterium]